jgi:hypothetical protein
MGPVNPQETVELLADLGALGFTGVAFRKLHHFRRSGCSTSIAAHRKYCTQKAYFQHDSTNERVHRRLRLVLSAYRAGGFTSGRPTGCEALAEAAIAEIPV